MKPIPELAAPVGWRDVPIEPVDEPLVAVDTIGPRVHDDPRYHAWGLDGALAGSWVREGVAARLQRAAATLPDGRTLVVWDGFRPLALQATLYNGYLRELAAAHPGWSATALAEAASRFVTPPSAAPFAPPPHLTGGAVDVTLGDADGRSHDLGTAYDAFVPAAAARALEYVDVPARDLRRQLFWAMAGEGFTAYCEEWWHFDCGNQFWGAVTGRSARYGAAEAPRCVDA